MTYEDTVRQRSELSRALVATPEYIQGLNSDQLRGAWRTIQDVLDVPEATIEQLRGLGALCDNYHSFSHCISGVPCRGRVINGREGVDVVIDVRYDTTRLRRIQGWIEQRLGYLMLTGQI